LKPTGTAFSGPGEAKDRRMYIVKKGQIVWTYDDPKGKGEISDAFSPTGGVCSLTNTPSR
jgi:hypothetical protein